MLKELVCDAITSGTLVKRDELVARVWGETQVCELTLHTLAPNDVEDAGMANAIQRLFDEPSEWASKKERDRAEREEEKTRRGIYEWASHVLRAYTLCYYEHVCANDQGDF